MLFSSKKIAVSSWTWHDAFYKGEISLIEIPAKSRQAGIGQVELNDFMLPPGRWSRTRELFRSIFGYENGSKKQQRYQPSTINKLIGQLKAHNVQCITWSIESDLTCSEELWRKELAYIIKGLQTTAQLDAQMIRMTLGGSERMGPEIDYLIIRRLKLIISLCKELFPTIQLIVENHWGITTDISRFLNIIDAVDGIGVCFDPGNVGGQTREQDWRKLAEKAQLFHLKIYEHDTEKMDQTIDYIKVFEELGLNDYTGKLVIEHEGSSDPSETLESILAQLKQWPTLAGFKAIALASAQKTGSQKAKGNNTSSAASFFKPLMPGEISLSDNQS
ncbi:MAG: sugar phosphate isomerase/epimerase family protein [Anaerolineae bacterium]